MAERFFSMFLCSLVSWPLTMKPPGLGFPQVKNSNDDISSNTRMVTAVSYGRQRSTDRRNSLTVWVWLASVVTAKSPRLPHPWTGRGHTVVFATDRMWYASVTVKYLSEKRSRQLRLLSTDVARCRFTMPAL